MASGIIDIIRHDGGVAGILPWRELVGGECAVMASQAGVIRSAVLFEHPDPRAGEKVKRSPARRLRNGVLTAPVGNKIGVLRGGIVEDHR